MGSMDRRRLVSLCSGTGGLDLAVAEVFDAETVALCEYDPLPSRVLAARFPGVVNLGDVQDTLSWAELSPSVLAAGYPCQPFSVNGLRQGVDDPRHLYPAISAGVERCRPELLALENVRGHLSLGWDVVLLDLDRLGYDVRWRVVFASDVGAPHPRARLFALARAREAGGWNTPPGHPVARSLGTQLVEADDGLFGPLPLPLNEKGSVSLWTVGALVDGYLWDSTPAYREPDEALLGTLRVTASGMAVSSTAVARGETRGRLEAQVALHMLPTPVARDWKATGPRDVVKPTGAPLSALPLLLPDDGGELVAELSGGAYGPYTAAVRRWEAVTRPAPPPLTGRHLSPLFVEWMMGLPAGWVTDPALWADLSVSAARRAQLAALGNGVVVQQATAAFLALLT